MRKLAEILRWTAYWIAAVVAMLALAAWATGAASNWVGVVTFFGVSICLWIAGRAVLWLGDAKRKRGTRVR